MDETTDKLLDWALTALSNKDGRRAGALYEQYADRIKKQHPQLARFYEQIAQEVRGEPISSEQLIDHLGRLAEARDPTIEAVDAGLTASLVFLKERNLSMFLPAMIEVIYNYNRIVGAQLSLIRQQNRAIQIDEFESLERIFERMNFGLRRLAEVVRENAP